jgi:hypothetical protein
VCIGSSRWIVRINARTERGTTGTTASELFFAQLELIFQVSGDEEYVHVSATANGRTIDLGARAHHYLLLELARRRLTDSERGLPDTACGWMSTEEFGAQIGTAPRTNVDIYRIRMQFLSAGVEGGAAIIERRAKDRGIRIGTSRLTVVSRA